MSLLLLLLLLSCCRCFIDYDVKVAAVASTAVVRVRINDVSSRWLQEKSTGLHGLPKTRGSTGRGEGVKINHCARDLLSPVRGVGSEGIFGDGRGCAYKYTRFIGIKKKN